MSCVSQFRASFLAAFGRIETSLLLTSYLASPDSLSRRRLVYELFGTKLEAPGAGEGDRKGVAAGPGYMYPGEYGREEVLLGVLEEAVEFAAKRGFTCGAVHQFLRLYLDALELLSSTDTTLSSTTTRLKGLAHTYSSTLLPPPFLLLSVQYITDTLLQHHHLYHYLLTDKQPTNASVVRLSVAPPTDPPPLQTGLTLQEWQRKERLKSLEAAQAEKSLECAEVRRSALQAAQERLEEAYTTELPKLDGSTQAEVTELVTSLTKAHVEQAQAEILQDMARHQLDIAFYVEQMEVSSPKDHVGPPSPGHKSGKESSQTPRNPSRQ